MRKDGRAGFSPRRLLRLSEILGPFTHSFKILITINNRIKLLLKYLTIRHHHLLLLDDDNDEEEEDSDDDDSR